MENPNQNLNQQPVEGNTFETTDLPDVDAAKKELSRKRVFWVCFGLIIIELGFLIWEIVDIVNYGK